MSDRIPILLYHSVDVSSSPRFRRWSVQPERFAAHLAHLREMGYTSLTVSEYVAARHAPDRSWPSRPVVITFDDGFADFHTYALPLLQRFGFTATWYVVTDHIGRHSDWLAGEGEGARPLANWRQLVEAAAAGIEIGAHTRRHPQLDVLSPAAAWDEVHGSKDALEQRLGWPVRTFAYPHGYHSAALQQLVRAAGYTSACAVKHALSSRVDDVFALARAFIFADTNVAGLQRVLQGQGLRPVAPRERAATWGWRLARRTLHQFRQSLRHVRSPNH